LTFLCLKENYRVKQGGMKGLKLLICKPVLEMEKEKKAKLFRWNFIYQMFESEGKWNFKTFHRKGRGKKSSNALKLKT
jgi:hypothetical protein